jgi:nicotinamide-nucleotide amidase
MIESNNLQAMVPENCEVLWNRNGTAPGMWFYQNNVVYISMPGVPFEMKTIFEEEAIPKIKNIFSLPSILHRTIQTIGIGESFLANKISKIEDNLPAHIKLAYLPAVGAVRLRFSCYGSNLKQLEDELNPFIDSLYQTIPEYIFAEGDETLSQVIGNLLLKNASTISTAESCSGGFLAHQITLTPGSSSYFMGSIISYDNSIKINELNVSNEILNTVGAVSEECVLQMANHLRKKFNTTYSLATSGIAGPGGGSESKPIGTVWIAIATPNGSYAKLFNMGDNRERTIQRTALSALDMLRKELLSIK